MTTVRDQLKLLYLIRSFDGYSNNTQDILIS